MKTCKKLIPAVVVYDGKVVNWFDDLTENPTDPVTLSKQYNDSGADELLLFGLAHSEEGHDEFVTLVRRIHHAIRIPLVVGGNFGRFEDVKKLIYAGAKRVLIDYARPGSLHLLEEASKRFGKDKLVVVLNDFDALFKHRNDIENYCSGLLFKNQPDLNSISNITNLPSILSPAEMDMDTLISNLKCENIRGVSGKFLSSPDVDFVSIKLMCAEQGIPMSNMESSMSFSEFKPGADGLLPVVVQDENTREVLMVAYMNEEAFNQTVRTGKMTYYSRSRQKLWIKGETSGHYQYVRSLTADCDQDTLLARVEQIGAACHTGKQSCFFQQVLGEEDDRKNPLHILESVYQTIEDRKLHPKEGSYTNYLFEKGIDKILKKLGEEATEIVIAAKNPDPEEIKYEIADFLYHAMVMMVEKNVTWDDIIRELSER